MRKLLSPLRCAGRPFTAVETTSLKRGLKLLLGIFTRRRNKVLGIVEEFAS
jgi:hypothetical protein